MTHGRMRNDSVRRTTLNSLPNLQMKLNIQCVSLSTAKHLSVVGLTWYSGTLAASRPVLAICYENGWAQIMRNENDDGELDSIELNRSNGLIVFAFSVPIIINAQVHAVDCKWNHDGTILAICGIRLSSSERDSNMVVFYSPYGVVSWPRRPFQDVFVFAM